LSAIRTVYVHYSVTATSNPPPSHEHDASTVRAIQRDHQDRLGYCDIAYASLIGGNGDVYLGRPNDVVQAAVYGHNHEEWSCCFLTDGPVTDRAWRSFQFMLYLAALSFPNVAHRPQPHSAAVPTACPGNAVRSRLTAAYG
jgi:hypothetical protein